MDDERDPSAEREDRYDREQERRRAKRAAAAAERPPRVMRFSRIMRPHHVETELALCCPLLGAGSSPSELIESCAVNAADEERIPRASPPNVRDAGAAPALLPEQRLQHPVDPPRVRRTQHPHGVEPAL
ncbi:MAG: hypothetical protein KF894_03590, partial [Labilithrix sp.]|nr:hypothetical protein [Labilithrix sp.]